MQNNILASLLAPWFLLGCASLNPGPPFIPEGIALEIEGMAADDQCWERLVMNRDPAIKEPDFFANKEALQLERAQRCQEILDTYGLPTPARVGPEVASDFWVLVQHADGAVDLQMEVLSAIESGPAGTYNPAEQAYLTDRVRVNTGRHQLFGTQMVFDNETARAYPKPLEDPARVDQRRAKAGMEPLVDYVNGVCESHFWMNRASYEEKGVLAAYQYAPDFEAWE